MFISSQSPKRGITVLFGTANIGIFFDLLNSLLKNPPFIINFGVMKWIFFDLDDTIWNFSANSAVSLRKLYEISPILRKLFKDVEEFIGVYHLHNARLWDLYARGEVTTRQLKVERWRRTLASKTFEVLTAVCEELESNYLDILAEGHEKIEGVEEMLEEVTKHALVAVLSNGFSKTQYKKLHFSGLERYVTRTIVSEEIGINKPNRAIFEYAVAETGATDPVVMVGDHPATDVLGALKAGWYAVWYHPGPEEFPYSESELREMGVDPSRYLGQARSIPEILPLLNL